MRALPYCISTVCAQIAGSPVLLAHYLDVTHLKAFKHSPKTRCRVPRYAHFNIQIYKFPHFQPLYTSHSSIQSSLSIPLATSQTFNTSSPTLSAQARQMYSLVITTSLPTRRITPRLQIQVIIPAHTIRANQEIQLCFPVSSAYILLHPLSIPTPTPTLTPTPHPISPSASLSNLKFTHVSHNYSPPL